MSISHNDQNLRIHSIDYLLILGFVLAPMTEFRIWKVGPAEAMMLVWSLRFLPSIFDFRKKNILKSFWIPFLLIVLAGTIFGMLRYPQQSSGPRGYITWIYMAFVSLGVYFGVVKYEIPYIRQLLKLMVIMATLWYIFLYFYAHHVSMEFLGARLYYHNKRYTGGASNPHQVAGLLVNCIFIAIYLAKNEKNVRAKGFYLVCVCTHLFLISKTISATAIMAAAAGLFLALMEWFIRRGKSKAEEKYRILMMALVSIFVLLFAFQFLFEAFYNWIASDPNGLGRLRLFASIGDTMKKNFLFGLGPGSHSLSGVMEYHNTYLEILAMGGIMGALVFAVFSIKLFKLLMITPGAMLAPFAMYVYGFAGFGMRRLSYWITIVIFFVISEKEYNLHATAIERKISRLQPETICLKD